MVSLSQRKSALRTTKTLIPSFRELSRRYANPFQCPSLWAPPAWILYQCHCTSPTSYPPLYCATMAAPIRYHKNRWPPSTRRRRRRSQRCTRTGERSFRMIDQSLLPSLVRRQIRSRDLAPFLINALAQSHPSLLFLPMTDHLWLCSPCLSRRHLLPRRGVLEPPRR